jgi:hypothetical protein
MTLSTPHAAATAPASASERAALYRRFANWITEDWAERSDEEAKQRLLIQPRYNTRGLAYLTNLYALRSQWKDARWAAHAQRFAALCRSLDHKHLDKKKNPRTGAFTGAEEYALDGFGLWIAALERGALLRDAPECADIAPRLWRIVKRFDPSLPPSGASGRDGGGLPAGWWRGLF